MGRAIVREPSVFLMDEPLSNLDAKLRVQMRADIAALQSRLGVTTVYVTHDQSEATLGHRVALLKDGKLQQCAPPADARRAREHLRIGFIGSPAMNLCELPCGSNGSVPFGGETVTLPAAIAGSGWSRIVLGLRPESLELAAEGIHASRSSRSWAPARYVFCVAEVGARNPSSSPAARRGTHGATPACTCVRARGRTSSIRTPARGSPADDGRSDAQRDPRAAARAAAPARPGTWLGPITTALARRSPSVVRLVGHGTSDNAASYGIYVLGLLPGWTALRDSSR